MQTRSSLSLIVLFITVSTLLIVPAPVQASMRAAGQSPTNTTSPVLWTTWGAAQSALADDGTSLWIGATGGVVRWDKQQSSYRRYTAVDGLPHTKVLAIAVDAAGNRWFGGDGGLSRLTANEEWSHFTTANSGLHQNTVTAIAVTANDTLYLSHGLPAGPLSRRQADGSWHWFPNRESAIQADYALIQQTRNQTVLWTVAGSEIWSGYQLFDGMRWHDRTPPNSTGQPIAMAVDSARHVWVLADAIREWNGTTWTTHPFFLPFGGSITALTVDAQDRVWIGWQTRQGNPYVSETAAISRLSGRTILFDLGKSGPVMALLDTAEGLWGIGPGWLARPDGTVTLFDDAPRFKDLHDGLVVGGDAVWFYSGYQEPYSIGIVQSFRDLGTNRLDDDRWQLLPVTDPPLYGRCDIVTAFERTVQGDLWYASYCHGRIPSNHMVVRYHQGTRLEYKLEGGQVIQDIFAQDEQHLWFAFVSNTAGLEHLPRGVLSLDDRGTPLDTSDDRWQSYLVTSGGQQPTVAIDASDRLWYGDATGLYRHTGTTWATVDLSHSICDLAPATDGTLYAQRAPFGTTDCGPYAEFVTAVRPDGTVEPLGSAAEVAETEFARVRTVTRRTSLWTVAPDGAVWSIAGSASNHPLQRRTAQEVQSFALPVQANAVQRMDVDQHNQVWLIAHDQLWRMSPLPEFSLAVQPTTWLLAPARSQQGQIAIRSSGGYSSTVTLAAINPPAGITVTIAPNPIAVDQVAQVTLTASPASPPAVHTLQIQASDTMLTHTVTVTVTVVSALHDLYLPIGTK